ncbi:SPFH/Band 7/PHB domain protein [Kingella denitrificans ATCC 33394]|uniref:SPFH/Band 7/PHB domain protein n=2 Tax=Kingella denitrificans TaxID=502 RepID=F0EZF9_9NEIS|nr:SPFH/Band 7/PHB domain protein [Kingella denitrificans ATCC 33394]
MATLKKEINMLNFIRKQFIDVIQWENPDEDTLVWRFPIADQEIQNGASLTVRESQAAVFVDEGVVADVFLPGRYTLNTKTLPVLTNLRNWDKFFQSPFKSDVYFFNTRQQLGKRWGTAQPVTVRDTDFGMVQLRAFGMYSYRIAQPDVFFKEVSGVVERYSGNDLETQLRNTVMTQMAAAFGTSNIPFLDMAANQVLLSQAMVEKLQPAFAALGLALESFTVESVTLPENVQQALDKRMSMNIVGDLGTYTQYQTAESIPLAAQNEGGLAGMGAGMGVGVGIGQAMAGAMSNTAAPNVQAASAPAADPNAKLAQLKTMLDNGLITQADYDSAKEQVLKQLLG